jgi:heavy metal sensor kinase
MDTMTLTTRLSVFFLAALTLVLAGFSTTLYLLAKSYLHRQVDERLEAALETLSAAVEENPQGVEWEPDERRMSLGRDTSPSQVRWVVTDPEGRVVECSPNSQGDDFLPDVSRRLVSDPANDHVEDYGGQTWKTLQRRVPRILPSQSEEFRGSAGSEDADLHARFYPALTLTVSTSLEPVRLTLRNLAVALGGLSLAIWLLAAIVGRWLCRRALVPVTDMATAARAMSAAHRDQRLPVAQRGDELEDLGRAFNDLLDRLGESFERQRRFTGDASHQLRTPLAAMLGQIEVALRRERPPGEYRQILTLLRSQADNLREIVEALLFLARADAEARLPELETVDLAKWVKDHSSRWGGDVRFRDLRVDPSSRGPLWVKAQPALLSQLLDNLWSNACKYSEAGAPILVRTEQGPDAIFLLVQDAGKGIASEDLPHVFEPFYRSPRERRLGLAGIGLGLAVARRIATALGGTLAVESRMGAGSRFTLRLPAACTTPREDSQI